MVLKGGEISRQEFIENGRRKLRSRLDQRKQGDGKGELKNLKKKSLELGRGRRTLTIYK